MSPMWLQQNQHGFGKIIRPVLVWPWAQDAVEVREAHLARTAGSCAAVPLLPQVCTFCAGTSESEQGQIAGAGNKCHLILM